MRTRGTVPPPPHCPACFPARVLINLFRRLKKPPRRHGDVFGNANEWDDVTVVFDLKVFGIIPLSYQTHLNEQM